jgi:hypothetical protein
MGRAKVLAVALALVGGLVLAILGTAGDKAERRGGEPQVGVPHPRRPAPGASVTAASVSLRLPPGWHGRGAAPNGAGAESLPLVLRAANFRLSLRDDLAAHPPMRGDGIRITVLEFPLVQAGTRTFQSADLPIAVARAGLARRLPGFPARHAVARRRVTISGRPFTVFAEFGSGSPTAAALERANAVLETLTVAPRAESDPRYWAEIRRPLRLAPVASDACPLSRAARVAPDAGLALGRGPVFAVVGGPAGHVSLRDDLVTRGWYHHKTLWAVAPDYRGPIVVRGRRLDGPGSVRFNRIRDSELRLAEAAGSARWRYFATHTLVRAPGCYGLQADGRSFSRRIVFYAQG